MVFNWLRTRDPLKEKASALCDAVFRGALAPSLYELEIAKDTIDGRFVMVALHGGLVLRRLKRFKTDGPELAERVGEAIFDRLDYGLREEGVGDSSIARKIRKLGERFFGAAGALDAALEAGDREALIGAVERNFTDESHAQALALYTAEADVCLTMLSDTDLMSMNWVWPKPATS